MTAGCAELSKVAPPAASYAANCKQPELEYPAVVKKQDLGERTGEWAAVAKVGHDRIQAENACVDAVATMSGKQEK